LSFYGDRRDYLTVQVTDFGAGIGLSWPLLFASVTEAADSSKGRRPVRVQAVALATFPVEAAATRFRIAQFMPALADARVDVTLLPFLNAADFEGLYDRKRMVRTAFRLLLALFRRIIQLPRILAADVLIVQREAMLVGPPLIEWLATRLARVPLVLDLDDATWMPMSSPVYGRWSGLLKFPSKVNWLIRNARTVLCGNEAIAAYVRAIGVDAVVLPTIVDAAVFAPAAAAPEEALPVVGWIGTHGTWRYVESILPTLETVARAVPFRLRIVGSGQRALSLRGIDIDLLPWRMDREVRDFQSLDVGLYPLPDDQWAGAKSGLKAIQYLACGVPYVASPVGVVKEIGEAGITHFEAVTAAEWCGALERLLRDPEERRRMGAAGRRHMIEHYSVNDFAIRIGNVLRDAAAPAPAEVCV
jgi:glycosyltransferase involved in cell wall biosynthesis